MRFKMPRSGVKGSRREYRAWGGDFNGLHSEMNNWLFSKLIGVMNTSRNIGRSKGTYPGLSTWLNPSIQTLNN